MPAEKSNSLNAPQQERSRETLRKLLDAAQKILADEPAKELSVRQVLKLSGVSNGSFYALFPNKEALIKECWKGLVESVDDNINRNFDDLVDQPLADKVYRLLEMQVKRYFKYRGLFRAYLNLMRSTNLKPTARNMKQYAQYGKKTRELLLASADEIRHPEPLHAISIAEFVTFAAARELIFYPHTPHASSMKLTQKRIIEELTNVYLAMLNYVPPKQ